MALAEITIRHRACTTYVDLYRPSIRSTSFWRRLTVLLASIARSSAYKDNVRSYYNVLRHMLPALLYCS